MHKATERVGEIGCNKYGWEMKIINWNGYDDIDIEFTYDGLIKEHVSYNDFKKGTISHPKYSNINEDELQERLNTVIKTKDGHTGRIINYRNASDIDIEFEDGEILYHKSFSNIKSGRVGYPKYGKFNVDIKRKISKHYYTVYKMGAKRRGLSFNLSFDFFSKLLFSNCIYCNYEGKNTYENIVYDGVNYNGIDRINPELGYEEWNVVPCCTMCNLAKNNLSIDEWIEYLNRVSNYLKDSEGLLDKIVPLAKE